MGKPVIFTTLNDSDIIANLVQALLALKMGICWCAMSFGHPVFLQHSEFCVLAQNAVAEARKKSYDEVVKAVTV